MNTVKALKTIEYNPIQIERAQLESIISETLTTTNHIMTHPNEDHTASYKGLGENLTIWSNMLVKTLERTPEEQWTKEDNDMRYKIYVLVRLLMFVEQANTGVEYYKDIEPRAMEEFNMYIMYTQCNINYIDKPIS